MPSELPWPRWEGCSFGPLLRMEELPYWVRVLWSPAGIWPSAVIIFQEPADSSLSTRSFRMLQAVSSAASSWTGSSIRQADWTRYSKTKRAPVLNQLLTVPLTTTITAMLGVFATGAVKKMYGKAYWQPIQLLEFLLTHNYNAATRAGCFFGGLGFFWSQIAVW